MSEEVQRLDALGQRVEIMKTLRLFVEHDRATETYTNCIEVMCALCCCTPDWRIAACVTGRLGL